MSAAPPAPPLPGAPTKRFFVDADNNIQYHGKYVFPVGTMVDTTWAQLVVDLLNLAMRHG